MRLQLLHDGGMSYGKRYTPCTVIHPFHVHVGAEQLDTIVICSVRLHAFEQCLRIMQHTRTRRQVEGTICVKSDIATTNTSNGGVDEHGLMCGASHPFVALHSIVSMWSVYNSRCEYDSIQQLTC